jgi:nucleoside-diphosphate-sugar epimerase
MASIMITGCQGYLGSELAKLLQVAGHKVTGFDVGFFNDAQIYPPEDPKIYKKDVRDLGIDNFIGIDAVVHLAGISNDPMNNLSAASIYDPTRDYSREIAKICKERGIKFIFASSCSVYGVGSSDFMSECSKSNPQTYYSLNKVQIEEDLEALADDNFSPIALRFATVFGLSPRIRFDVVINMFIGMAITSGRIVLNSDGQAWRPHLHIEDACESIRCAIEYDHDAPSLLVLNVGLDDNNMQIIDVARSISDCIPDCQVQFLQKDPSLDGEGLILDRKIKEGADKRTYKVSFEKIKKTMPNLKLKWSVKEGVRDMIQTLNTIGLDRSSFLDRGFYRLQRLEDLLNAERISNDLRWINK